MEEMRAKEEELKRMEQERIREDMRKEQQRKKLEEIIKKQEEEKQRHDELNKKKKEEEQRLKMEKLKQKQMEEQKKFEMFELFLQSIYQCLFPFNLFEFVGSMSRRSDAHLSINKRASNRIKQSWPSSSKNNSSNSN